MSTHPGGAGIRGGDEEGAQVRAAKAARSHSRDAKGDARNMLSLGREATHLAGAVYRHSDKILSVDAEAVSDDKRPIGRDEVADVRKVAAASKTPCADVELEAVDRTDEAVDVVHAAAVPRRA